MTSSSYLLCLAAHSINSPSTQHSISSLIWLTLRDSVNCRHVILHRQHTFPRDTRNCKYCSLLRVINYNLLLVIVTFIFSSKGTKRFYKWLLQLGYFFQWRYAIFFQYRNLICCTALTTHSMVDTLQDIPANLRDWCKTSSLLNQSLG